MILLISNEMIASSVELATGLMNTVKTSSSSENVNPPNVAECWAPVDGGVKPVTPSKVSNTPPTAAISES